MTLLNRGKEIFMTNSYNLQDNEKVLIILNLLSREGMQFMLRLNDEEEDNVNPAWSRNVQT